MSKPVKHPRVYAWRLEDGSLCRFAEARPEEDDRPSPGATAQMVRLVPEADYRRMMNPAKREGE